MQLNFDLFDTAVDQIHDIANSTRFALHDIANEVEGDARPSQIAPITDIAYSEIPIGAVEAVVQLPQGPDEPSAELKARPAAVKKPRANRPALVPTGDAWCSAVLESAIAFKTALKDLQKDTVTMCAVLDAITYVARCKRDAYAAALVRPAAAVESILFGWSIKNPELARHTALLNSKNIDLNLIPMLPPAAHS